LSGQAVLPGRAVNLSTRVAVTGGENVGIGGLIVQGPAPKRILFRGIGPSLSARGVAGALPDPRLEVFDQAGNSIAANNNWQETQAAEIIASGAPPTDMRESAIVLTLEPGSYTVVMSGNENTSGVGLVEMYDLNPAAGSTLTNLSARGRVGVGDDVLIGGVIIEQGGDPIVVVRALGPSLAAAGVQDPLLDPMLELYDRDGTQIGVNDDWQRGQAVATRATLLAPTDDREAAITASLPPGNYTAIVRGKNDTTGVALVEVFRIP
jgi:hypothetical protein